MQFATTVKQTTRAQVSSPEDVQELINSKQKQAFYYNLKGAALPELQPGQTVRMKMPQESTWTESCLQENDWPAFLRGCIEWSNLLTKLLTAAHGATIRFSACREKSS